MSTSPAFPLGPATWDSRPPSTESSVTPSPTPAGPTPLPPDPETDIPQPGKVKTEPLPDEGPEIPIEAHHIPLIPFPTATTQRRPYAMPLTEVEEFSGKPDTPPLPAIFIKRFKRRMEELGKEGDSEKIAALDNYLVPSSPAEKWYKGTGLKINSWAKFITAFEIRFPTIEEARKTSSDLQREIEDLILPDDDLGKTAPYAGVQLETHKIHAKKLLELAQLAEIETTTTLIYKAHDNLPEVLREKVSEKQESWATFCAAVEEVDPGVIRQAARKLAASKAREKVIEARFNRLEHQPRSTTQPTTNTRPHTTTSPANTSLPSTKPTQTYRQSFTPTLDTATDTTRNQVREALARYPQQNTLEAYQGQLAAWTEANPTKAITPTTGFPLAPGTAPVCSSECYRCGMQGHQSRDCTVPRNRWIHFLEKEWRNLCRHHLARHTRPHGGVAVNMIGTEGNDLSWMGEGIWSGSEKEGNGGGPSV